ncbi:hypothetical protein LTR28_010724 [Elasticomyces elasticus]|nr:hypothetical protein LTR28_010724 [Elasticomyces elasticus]
MERRDKGADIVLVASEPLTFERGSANTENWVTVPTNSTLTIHNQTVLIHPIVDEFYSPSPSLKRSAKFAATKGQSTTNAVKAAGQMGLSRENSVEGLRAEMGRLGGV